MAEKRLVRLLDGARTEREVVEGRQEAAQTEGQGCWEQAEAPAYPLENPLHLSSHREQASTIFSMSKGCIEEILLCVYSLTESGDIFAVPHEGHLKSLFTSSCRTKLSLTV